MVASVGLVIASYIPRRAYATAVIVGVFVLTFTVATILMETVDTEYAQYALLVSPAVWDGIVFWLFGSTPPGGTSSRTRASPAGCTSSQAS